MKRFTFLILALVFGLNACSFLQIGPKGEGEYVYSESLVPYDELNLSDTKKRGVYAAQKNAVEQVSGVFVSSSTTIDHSVVVENQILSKTQGFIRRYHVTDAYRKGDLWYTRIRALVLVSEIGQIIKESEDAYSVKKTNIMVASKETVNGDMSLTQDCKQAIYKALKPFPYALINGDNLSQSNLDDPTGTIDKGRYEGARFVIVADANAFPLDNLSGLSTPFKPYRARVNLRVYSAKNYGVIAESTQQQSGLDPVESIAAQKALSASCEAAGKDILDSLRAAVNSAKTYTVTIKDVNSIDRLSALQSVIREMREVEDYNLIRYKNSAAVFEVQANIKTSEELAAKIIRQHSSNFTIMSTTPQSITLTFS
ncbi:hypothetical protein Dip518_000719 [Parelusimicrobium proximum]|uniref:hypothetical protein n=1 Tax=Parelusimicrobium proximum TaxID=3228953 RepID=UPI003D1653C3